MIGDFDKTSSQASLYNPSKDIKHFTKLVQEDYASGDDILTRGWTELNNDSVIDDTNRGQMMFNAFVEQGVDNPGEAWKWRGTRSKARNKAVQMHAQITAGYIFPAFMAQNEDDEEDRDFSEMMNDSVEWLGHNSNYKSSFLMATMGMLVNTVTYMSAEWFQVMQTIKQKMEDGSYSKKEIIDEVLSGFNANVYGPTDILISNAFEQNIQRHRFNITRRYIEYSEAEAKYGNHENWHFVMPGTKSIYDSASGMFYDVKDDDHPYLVAEDTYKNRRDDTEVCFIGGIYMGNDDIEANPIRHRDHKGAPKYNVVPFGYQRINEHFFFYKSLMNSMRWDNQLADAQYELGMNTAFLMSNMPTAIAGSDNVDSDIMFPSSVVSIKNENARAFPLLPGLNPGALFGAFKETERSMDEASVSEQTGGNAGNPNLKATAIAVAERNAQTMIQGVGKTIAESMVQYGSLMADIAVNNLSIAQIDELSGDSGKVKYRTLILKDKVIDGKQVDKILRFDESLLGNEEMTKDEKKKRNLELLDKVGYPDNKHELYLINPMLFSRMKYLTRIEPETMFPKNKEYMQAIYSQVYAQFQNNPFVSLEALTRESLYAYFGGKTEKLMQKQQPNQLSSIFGAGKETAFGSQGQNSKTAVPVAGVGA